MTAPTSLEVETDGNLLLERIKKAKGARAVQKAHFASFASAIPDNTQIFSFEGPDDRVIYYSWIGRLAAELRYEAYQCNGKKQVLQLFDLLSEDKTGLGDRVYFFVDRDFDGLQGRSDSERIFVTDRYSVENYVVCEHVLDDVLNVAFHCHGSIELRQLVIKEFKRIYDEFLVATTELNFRIFLARYCGIDTENLPASLHNYLEIRLDGVVPIGRSVNEFVQLKYEPTDEQIEAAKRIFKDLTAPEHYRGKFAVTFFTRWLGLLRGDRMAANTRIFAGVPAPINAVHGDFSFQYLAPKTRPPAALTDFLQMVVNNVANRPVIGA